MLALGSFVSWLWLAPLRSLIVAAALAWFWRDYRELHQPGPARAADWLLGCAAGLAIFVAWIWLDRDWMVFERLPGFEPRSADGAVDWPLALVRLAGFALVVPVMEELFWRSFLLRWLERQDFLAVAPQKVGWRSFAITTVLFALEHNQWLAGAIAGAVYSGVYMRSGNLWVPVVAHMITNAVLGVWILSTGNWHFW